MNLRILGKKRREDATYYAAYSTTGQLIEFVLMVDVSPALVGQLNKAIETQDEIELDTNDIQRFAAVKWK